MLYLLITWFQDSQAKSLKTQDNFATVNAEKSGEGKEKGGEKNYLLLFFCCVFFSPTTLQSYKSKWVGLCSHAVRDHLAVFKN